VNGLRVLLVNAHGTDPAYGGAERYVAGLAEGIAERGGEALVLAAFPGASTVPAERLRVLHGSDWRESALRRLSNHAGDILSTPRRELEDAIAWAKPDVVHTSNLPGIGTGVWEAASRTGVPVVHTLHDYHLLCPRTTLLQPDGSPCRPHPALCGFRTRRLARWAPAVDAVVGVSDFVLEGHAPLFPDARKRTVRHAFVPPAAPPAPPPERLRVLGYLGALDPVKGVDRLLGAAATLALETRIAGDGRLRERVDTAPSVRYEGIVESERKAAFLAGCDLGVVPSVWDEPGAPAFTVLDWLFAGRPVLASGRGGLAEVRDRLPGVIEIEPTVEAIRAEVMRLSDPTEWRDAVAAVRPPDTEGRTREDWLDAHELVYAGVRR
jgi:glycosyltransferase involved in cell wall biosynthesis